MSEFLRSLLGRLRGYAGDRRNARRYVRLPLSVSPIDTHKRTNGRRALPTLEGYTKDISNNGLGIILPAIRIGEHYLVGEDRPLQIVLQLPSGPIQMQAMSTRYERLDEGGNELGYLIGVRITKISDQHRETLTAFIKKQQHT
ncbi:MAG: PilZ domain-containing protein [Acidobacteriota bacterium]